MSTMPGLASKAEKGKSKFQSLDINNLYRHSLGENLERSAQKSAAPLKHGMQSLGKVPSARRPPANLPSVKAEQNNTSSTPITVTSESQVATAGGQGSAVVPLLQQEHSQQPQSWVGKQGTGDKIGTVGGAGGLPMGTLATTGSQSQQQQPLQLQISAHQAAIALPITNTILPPQKQQQNSQQQNAQQLTAQQQIQQGTLSVYHHMTAVQQAQLQHLQMQTAAVAAAAAQVAQTQQTQGGTGLSQGANGTTGPVDKSWSSVMSSVNVDGHGAMVAMGAALGLGGTVGGGAAGSHHHHSLHHHGMQGVGGMQQPPPYHSVQFQHEFPSLSASTGTADSGGGVTGIGGNVGNGRVGNQGGIGVQQSQIIQQPPPPLPLSGPDVQYGPGPSLRPQTEGSWMQGGGAQARIPGHQQQQQTTVPVAGQGNQSSQPNVVSVPGTQQMSAHFRGIVPSFMFRGSNFPPMNGHHGPLPPHHQQSMAAQQHHPQHSEGRQGHQGPVRRGGAPADQPLEVITHRPIIREEELSRMDDMVRDMGWAAHEDIDYNQQLAFSDDDDSIIEDGGGKIQSGIGGTGSQRGKILGMQSANQNDHRSDRSDNHHRSGSHPNHQSQSQQLHKDSLHHHHHSMHQQHPDSTNTNYQSTYGSRQQQQLSQASSTSSGNNSASCVGVQNASSATLCQQKSWSSSGSSSTGGSGGNRSSGATITRRSNECDDEIAERRRQQNQAMSTVIERARQRKEEEEKRYLDSKQAANKKLQELDERSKNKREQREFDESTGTITQASVPPQPIMHSTIPVPEWEREKDNRDNRERILRESSEEKSLKSSISDENNAITPSPSASNFHQLTQIESGRGNTYRKDTTSGSLTSSLRAGCGNTVTETGTPPPFSRQFQTNLPPRFQKHKQQATGGAGNSGGPPSLAALGGQYDAGRYAAGKGSSPPQQQQDRGDRQQPMHGPRGAKEDKDMHQRDRDRDIREDRDRDDHSSRGYAASRGKQTSNSNTPSSSFNLPQGSDEGVTYRQTRYSSSSNRYSDDYSREYDYNSNNNTGSGTNRTVVGKSNNMTSSSSVGKELDRRGYEKQDNIEIENTRGSRHSSSDEWASGRDRYDKERPQRPDSRDSRASRDSRHSMESVPRHSEPRDFSSWSESPYEPPYEPDQQHKQQQKHQQQPQSRHLTVPGPITKERLEQFSDDLKSSDKHHGVGQAHHNIGGLQHQPQQRTSGLTQLKRGGGGVDKKIVDDDAWTIRRGGSSSTKEGSGSNDAGLGSGGGSAVSTAWADSMPDDKQLEKQISDHHDNKKDCDDLKGRRIDSRNIGSNKNSNNWSDSGRESAPYCRNNSWTSSKKSSSSTSSISGGGVGGNRSDRSDRLSQYSRNQRPPSVKSGESEGSADEVSVSVESSAKDEVTKHIKKIEKDEKNKELLRAILPEPIKKPHQSITSDSKSKDSSGSGCTAVYIPRGEPSRHGRGGGSNSGSFRGGRSSVGGGVKRMDYYGLPAASKSPFGNNQDDKEKKSGDDSAVASHITDEDKAKVQQKNEQLPNEQDKERYGKSKRSDNRRSKQRGPKDDGDLVSDNSEDGKGGKRLDNQQKLSNRTGGSGNLPFSGGGRKTATSNVTGGQMGNQQQSRQQNNSDKRYGNSYNNSGRQNSSSNIRNTSRKDNISTKEEVEDDLPCIEGSFQEVRIKKTPTTGMKQEDIKSSGPVTATAVGNVKVPVLSGGGAIVVAPTSSTAMAAVPAPGGKVDKDGSKSVGASSGIGKPGGKPGGPPGLSQQHIANIPSLMSVPVNPPMMKGQYDRDRGVRQNKLPPRLAKQREYRLNNQQQHVGQANMDQQSSIHTSTSASDAIKPPTTTSVTFATDSGTQISGSGTVTSTSSTTATPVGNAWDKPLTVTQLRSSAGGGLVVESEGMTVGGQVGDGVGKLKDGEVDKSGMLSECAAPVNTIIFENSNYKSTSSPAGTAVRVPITTNRNTGPPLPPSNSSSISSSIIASNTQPRSIQQQMEDQAAAAAEAAVLGTLSSGKGDNGSKGDVNMMFSKEDDAGMKMDFFESEISHLTDDKSSGKNIGLARSIQQTMVGSTAGSISASTADALNIKIQSVKKVWENANDHPVVMQDDGSGFVSGFGSDHNSLDPSGAFGKSADTPDDTHEGYSPSPNQNVSSANTNVCKVKPNQQATAAAAAAAAAQAGVHSASIVSASSMVSVTQHQHQHQQVQVQQAQHQAHAQAAAVAAQAAAQAVAAQAAAAQAVQMGHHGSTMVGHQVLGHPLSPPPPLSSAAVLGATSCQPTGGGGAFGTGQHLGYQSLGGNTNYNLSAIPSPPTVLHQFSSSQSQLQAAVAAAVQQTSLYGNFSQMDAQSHQVATARAPQYATPQYANPYGIGATASSPYSTSVPPPQSLYLPPSGPPPPHGPPPGPPGSGTGAPGSVPPPPDHLYQNLNNYRLAAAAAAAAAGGSPFANQQSNPATVLISSNNNSSLMSASVVGKSGVGGGSGNGGGASGSGQISAIGTKAGGVGPAYTSHSHSQQAAQQLAYMTYDLSMGAYHLPPPPPQQRGQQGGGPPPGPPPQGSSQVQQSNSSYYNQNTGGQTGYFQPQQSGGVNTTGQQPQLGNSGSGGGLATQHAAAAAAAYSLQAVATAAALFGNQSHQPISNATSLQNYGSHYLNNNMLAAINVQQQQQQQQQQYRSQQQYMKNSNQPLLMDQQPGIGGRQQLKSPGNQQDGLSSVFNSSPQIPSPKARQQNCKVQPPQQQQQQLAQMSQSSPVSNVQHNKYNLYNVPPTMTNQPPLGQVRYPAPIQRPINFQANLGSAQNTVSGNNPKHRPNNINNRPSTGSRQYYGQAVNHTVNDVTKSDENTISKLSEQIVSTGGAANGTTVSTATHKAAPIATVGVNSNVTSNVAAVSSDSIASAKDTNNSNPQPQASNKDETSAATGIKD